jgi:hypothetical protein
MSTYEFGGNPNIQFFLPLSSELQANCEGEINPAQTFSLL